MIRKSNKMEDKKGFDIEDLKKLKKLLEEYTSTDEVKVEKVIKIKM